MTMEAPGKQNVLWIALDRSGRFALAKKMDRGFCETPARAASVRQSPYLRPRRCRMFENAMARKDTKKDQ